MQGDTNWIVEDDARAVLGACQNELLGLRGKTLLITGATGFVASGLVESIIAMNSMGEGAPCRLFLSTRSVEDARTKRPQFFGLPDVTWFEWSEHAFPAPLDSCDYIVHAASPADPALYLNDAYGTMERIASGTRHVLDFARQAHARRIVYLSSGAVYGPQPPLLKAIPETFGGGPSLRDPKACYGEAKRYSELLCQLSGVPVVIARLFAFVGPHQDLSGSFAVTDFIRQAAYEGAIGIKGNGAALRTYCYASDLTIALWKILMLGEAGDAYNVGRQDPAVSILELAALISGMLGGVEVTVQAREASSHEHRSRYIPDISKLRHYYDPKVGLEEALARTLYSMHLSGKLPITPVLPKPFTGISSS